MHKDLAELCIGALLHDIGKISERARLPLSEQSEGMRPQICPTQKDGRYGYHHVVHTNEFFENLKTWLPSELDSGKIANIASYHHSPSDVSHLIVQQADWLSAGQDRQEDEQQSGIRDYSKSIFSTIPSQFGQNGPDDCFLPLYPLSLGEENYPRPKEENLHPVQDYQSLWKIAFEHFGRLESTNPAIFMEQLIWIYSLYGGCVPSHRTKHFEISLLDHSLTTAAFAAALYQYHAQTNTLDEASIKDRKINKFRLVSGDLSGIQSYLYQTTLENPSGVSKRLRSKSFYLGLVTRLAGNLILERLGLPCLSRIIDAGGNFTLLIHNTDESLKCVKETEQLIQHWFQDAFGGHLNLNLCYDMELSGEDFSTQRFHTIQEKLSWQMDRSKKQPLDSILKESGRWSPEAFVLPFMSEPISPTPQTSQMSPEDVFFNEMGTKLTSGNTLMVDHDSFDGAFSSSLSGLPLVNPFGHYFFTVANSRPKINGTLQSCVEFVPGTQKKSLQNIQSGTFLANYVPRQTDADQAVYQDPQVSQWLQGQLKEESEDCFSPGQRKSFAHLCADAYAFDRDGKPKGQPLLAVMKADVDRLGMLFSKGLETAKASLSYYISLSRQLDLFFSGMLPNLFLDPPKGYEDFRNIYTVYAGGDDLLLVGPWRTLLKFAPYLQNLFRRYVCYHPDITLSAGITVCHSRFPLSQAASQADDALKKAKENRDRICVFDTVLEWPDFEQAIDDGLFLDRIMQEDGAEGIKAAKGFVYRLIRYCQMANESRKLKNLLWRSHLKYDIARNVRPLDKNNKRPAGLQRLEQMTALTKNSNEMARLKVAVTYCLYLNR